MQKLSLVTWIFPFKLPSRINRVQYIARTLLYTVLSTSLILYTILEAPNLEMFTLILSLIAGINLLILTIKRSHDVDYNGWWLFLAIPFILVSTIFLWIAPGTKNDNKFGTVPNKATKIEYVLAILLVPVFIFLLPFIKRN